MYVFTCFYLAIRLLIYDLFNDAAGSSVYIKHKDRINNEEWDLNLWRRFIKTNIVFLDIIRRPVTI
jgi:hypothetical protein